MPLIGSMHFATDGLKPDLTLYFDIEVEEGLARIAANSDREVNRLDLEGLDLHKKVRKGYLSLLDKEGNRIVKIDASLPWSKLWKRPRLSYLTEWAWINETRSTKSLAARTV